MGFHGGAKRMWFNNDFMAVARDCEKENWLIISGS